MSGDIPRADALRLALLRAAMDALQAVEEGAPAEGTPLAEEVSDSRWRVRIMVEPQSRQEAARQQAGPPGSPRQAEPPAGEYADAIRAVLRKAPRALKVGAIARAAGHDPPSSWFREVLRRLVAAGEVLHLPGHFYWLASRPLPQR